MYRNTSMPLRCETRGSIFPTGWQSLRDGRLGEEHHVNGLASMETGDDLRYDVELTIVQRYGRTRYCNVEVSRLVAQRHIQSRDGH